MYHATSSITAKFIYSSKARMNSRPSKVQNANVGHEDNTSEHNIATANACIDLTQGPDTKKTYEGLSYL
ncbi:hypothetical protein DSUL_50109 [Desulfovibrionales bacterium]